MTTTTTTATTNASLQARNDPDGTPQHHQQGQQDRKKKRGGQQQQDGQPRDDSRAVRLAESEEKAGDKDCSAHGVTVDTPDAPAVDCSERGKSHQHPAAFDKEPLTTSSSLSSSSPAHTSGGGNRDLKGMGARAAAGLGVKAGWEVGAAVVAPHTNDAAAAARGESTDGLVPSGGKREEVEVSRLSCEK